MSGLLALLDDVAGIAKVAAAQIDDVAAQAAKAGAKAAGAVIDDAAVTPKYVHGFAASRELPIVGKIALGSIRNKLIFLLPIGLLLTSFAPWMITPLLMLGGSYLCFEGAEKLWHSAFPGEHVIDAAPHEEGDPARLEAEKVSGAIKTDFILSAEIMTIALSAIPHSTLLVEALVLAIVALGITAAVYGSVAVLVKLDDIGLLLVERGHLGLTRALGRGMVQAMPIFMVLLTWVGTAAMLWVGGNIVTHGLEVLGLPLIYDSFHHWAEAVAAHTPEALHETIAWSVTAMLDGIFAILFGLILIPIGTHIVGPLWRAVFNRGKGGKAA